MSTAPPPPQQKLKINTTRPLPDEITTLMEAGIWTAAAKWSVTLPEGISFDFPVQLNVLGNHNLSPKTKLLYRHHYRQFWRFRAWVGDYDSMLIFLNPVIKKFLAINVETLELFLRYKGKPKDIEIDTRKPALNVFGLPFDACGQ